MKLPIPTEYLAVALVDGYKLEETKLVHGHIGDLVLPTGRLVACDPFVFPDAPPYNLQLPIGTFPVVMSVAHLATDQRVAFASLRLSQNSPATWEMMTVGNQNVANLEEDHIFGYGVDSGTGCFMDQLASQVLAVRMQEQNDFFETIMAEMKKNYVHTWDWTDMRFGAANLIAFSSGLGDGVYASYAGFDPQNNLAVIVTDFGVVSADEFPS
jgi:hypothetical protein